MLILQLAFTVIMFYLIWLFLYSLIFGAPYAAVGKERLVTMMRLANIKKGERAADLGSGDGRIVIELAKKGAISDGYEINPVPYIASRYFIKTQNVKNARVFLKDLWKVDLSEYNVITLYGNFPMMKRLEKKLKKELRPGARVVSNHFQFPNWKFEKQYNDVYLYIK